MLDKYFIKKDNKKDIEKDDIKKDNIVEKSLNIWTWNVNSIRTKVELVSRLLLKHDIDILFLTETKILKSHETITFDNYKCIWNSNKHNCYHGVVFIYKQHLDVKVISNILKSYNDYNFDIKPSKNEVIIKKHLSSVKKDIEKAYIDEGRILTIKLTLNDKEIMIVGTYVPNSGRDNKDPLKRLAFRTLCWDVDLYKYLNELKKDNNVIWIGDLNVIRCDNDTVNVNYNIAGLTPEERNNMKQFMNEWIDVWDDCHHDIKKCKDRATWLGNNLKSTFPLRLDYVICSQSLKESIVSSKHDQSFTGSDHIPIGVQFLN